ncbi:MAG TPA: hypothetical protein VEB40_06650, partial [Flavipsychrobacter sp.]|nr:hypothetical protein [Flavipsychrobacter sp.]
RRYNIQYMGISIVIVLSFIVLAILGSFKVHRVVVKALGFFSFIFFFEFIIMFADHEIHHFTHGEPWKFMLFKIMLIAILLPLHHWLEEKVIHYLVSHRMVDASRMSFSSFFRNLKNNIFGVPDHPVVVPAAVDNDLAVAEPAMQTEIVTTQEPEQAEEKK